MNEEKRSDSDGDGRSADAATARLIAVAGARGRARRPVPPGARDRVHAAVHGAWREATQEKRTRRERNRWRVPVALAASVALAGILIARFPGGIVSPETPVATVAVVSGELRGPDGERLRPGAGVTPGAQLATDGAGRAALRLADGTSLRLDHDTLLTLAADARLRLDAGAVYIDTAPAGGDGDGVTVITPHATATDLGTQFEVRTDPQASFVRVREGQVAIATGPDGTSQRHVAPAGEAARIDAGGGLATSEIAPYDDSWAWTEAVAPAFDTSDARSLHRFLAWSARELGLELRYLGDTSATADAVTLSGSVEGMTPRQALAAVMATTSLDYRVEDGRLEVYRR